MKKILTLIVLILVGLVSPSYGQDTELPEETPKNYLCIAEQSAGFYYNKSKKEWLATTFKTDGKYIIREGSEEELNFFQSLFEVSFTEAIKKEIGPKPKYVVVIPGIDEAAFICPDYDWRGHLNCEGAWTGGKSFWFNNQSLRFMKIDNSGYVITLTPVLRFEGQSIPYNPYAKEGKYTPHMEIGTCTPF